LPDKFQYPYLYVATTHHNANNVSLLSLEFP